MYTDNKKYDLYKRTEKHGIFLSYGPNASYVMTECTGCEWRYHPTEYERKNAYPMADLLSYYHWMHVLDILAKEPNNANS